MDIKLQVEIISKIVDVFSEDYRDELVAKKDEIKEDLKEALNKYRSNFNLVFNNSVHEINYYSIHSRVKKVESFLEKLIRKSDGLKIIHELGIKEVKDVEIKREGVEQFIKKYDDIIGIKIETELKKDCEKVYELLENHKDELENIKFIDFNDQPKTMQNGLPIYNIKGVYMDEYGFELQIKSKIDSAWGDIDHGLFYKNYVYSPIKDTVQITMSHVGNMLEEVEDLLFSLRKANNNYSENAKRTVFIEKINNNFAEDLKNILSVPYRFERIIDFLFFLNKKFNGEFSIEQDIIKNNLEYTYLDFEYEEEVISDFFLVRNASTDLTILENIYLQWFIEYEKVHLDKDNYKKALYKLLNEKIIEYLKEEVCGNLETFEILDVIWPELLKYVKSDEVILASKKYKKLFQYKLMLQDIEHGFTDCEDELVPTILVMFGIFLFGGNIQKWIKDNWQNTEDWIEISKFIFDEMNNTVTLMGNKDNPKYAEVKEFVKINIALFNLIVKTVEGE